MAKWRMADDWPGGRSMLQVYGMGNQMSFSGGQSSYDLPGT